MEITGINTENINNSNAFTIWLTGLPGSGKTTIGSSLVEEFKSKQRNVELLDGDELRKIISSELGFSKRDRDIHLNRVTYLCELLNRNGIITIVALISPYKKSREFARSKIKNFVEVWVNCPLDICIKRDPKGLYKKANDGELNQLTGIQDPYENPPDPEIIVYSGRDSVEQCTQQIIRFVEDND